MRNLVLQLNAGEYRDFVSFLDDLKFERIGLDIPGARFMTKAQLLGQYLRGTLILARRWRQLRRIDNLVVFGHFVYPVKLLARIGLIRYRKLFCFAFFVHDPRLFPLCRLLVRLDRASDFYLVFSHSEIALYQRLLDIDGSRLVYIPYGDWGQFTWQMREQWPVPNHDYYIAGGSSNRDYVGLVEVFRSISGKLLIVCSNANWQELRQRILPANVEVLCDVSSDVFEALVHNAKVGIVPLKLDTGASGQSVALALMRNSKCVIASDVGSLREYIEEGVSGFLLQSLADLPDIIRRLEENDLAESMGRAARARYDDCFSRHVVADAFAKLFAA
jgi:glycosyltransferase involved in cell wall biosynthesis